MVQLVILCSLVEGHSGFLSCNVPQIMFAEHYLCFLDIWEVNEDFTVNTVLHPLTGQFTGRPSTMCCFK